ncbi:hypothetical protein CHISP_2732 [Chitinispirillum alkaliphilum]|nr:hypothetical protein CHISP_2732 [Chitinispirillum alkaliphilum]
MRKMVFILTLFGVVFLSYSDQANEGSPGGWDVSFKSNLSVSLNAYSDNWIGRDVGAFTWVLRNDISAEKEFSEWTRNRTNLILMFGQTSLQDRETKVWAPLQKSSDQINIETIQRFTLGFFTDPFISAGLLSQFVDERDTLLTRYFNPLEIKGSAGAIRDLYRAERTLLTTRLGFAVRNHYDRDVLLQDNTRDNVFTTDGGVDVVADFEHTTENEYINITSRLGIYKALFRIDEEAEGEEGLWRYPDVNWDSMLGVALTRYLMLGVNFQLLYDRELDSRPRFKHLYTLGVRYALRRS